MASKDSEYNLIGQSGSFLSFIEGKQTPLGRGLDKEIERTPAYEREIFRKSQTETPVHTELVYDHRLENHHQAIQELKKEIQELKKRQTVFHSRLTSIPSEKYELRAPIDVIIKIYDDEVIALVPELEIYGEGCNEFEALNDLKYELIDLLEDLDTYSDEHLGKTPQGWSKTLKALIEKCQ